MILISISSACCFWIYTASVVRDRTGESIYRHTPTGVKDERCCLLNLQLHCTLRPLTGIKNKNAATFSFFPPSGVVCNTQWLQMPWKQTCSHLPTQYGLQLVFKNKLKIRLTELPSSPLPFSAWNRDQNNTDAMKSRTIWNLNRVCKTHSQSLPVWQRGRNGTEDVFMGLNII